MPHCPRLDLPQGLLDSFNSCQRRRRIRRPSLHHWFGSKTALPFAQRRRLATVFRPCQVRRPKSQHYPPPPGRRQQRRVYFAVCHQASYARNGRGSHSKNNLLRNLVRAKLLQYSVDKIPGHDDIMNCATTWRWVGPVFHLLPTQPLYPWMGKGETKVVCRKLSPEAVK